MCLCSTQRNLFFGEYISVCALHNALFWCTHVDCDKCHNRQPEFSRWLLPTGCLKYRKALQAVPYKPPHKAEAAHAQYLQPFACAAASGRQAAACMRISSASSAGSNSGSHEAAAPAVLDDNSPHGPAGSSPHGPHGNRLHDPSVQLAHAALTSWECRHQQELQECTFSPRLNPHTRKSKSVVAQVWKHSTGRANPLSGSAAVQQTGSAKGAVDAAAAGRGFAAEISPDSLPCSSASTNQAASRPHFVTAPMHHEAARARHRHLISYAATAPPAAAQADCALTASSGDACGDLDGRHQQQQAGPRIDTSLSADEAELQAALLECNRQQRLLHNRWHGRAPCSTVDAAQTHAAATDRCVTTSQFSQHAYVSVGISPCCGK